MSEPPFELNIPRQTLEDWQDIVNLMAELIGVPAGLIMRLSGEDIEVLVAAQTPDNPYNPGDREVLRDSGLYCEEVIRTNDMLLVKNALTDPDWQNSPDIKLNMVSYLGLPIHLPDGRPFGTICLLDNRENAYGQAYCRLVGRFRDIIEGQLELLWVNQELRGENRRLADYVEEVKTLRGLIPICPVCRRIRDGYDYWPELEGYLKKHTDAQFSLSLCPDCQQDLFLDNGRGRRGD